MGGRRLCTDLTPKAPRSPCGLVCRWYSARGPARVRREPVICGLQCHRVARAGQFQAAGADGPAGPGLACGAGQNGPLGVVAQAGYAGLGQVVAERVKPVPVDRVSTGLGGIRLAGCGDRLAHRSSSQFSLRRSMVGGEELIRPAMTPPSTSQTAPVTQPSVIGSEWASVQIRGQASGYQEPFASWPRYPPSVGFGIVGDV